jgi:hypothetical protein
MNMGAWALGSPLKKKKITQLFVPHRSVKVFQQNYMLDIRFYLNLKN